MSKTSNITSMAELHKRQEELKQEQEAAQAGLASSLKRTPRTMSRFAYEDLALPAMGLGLAVYVGYRLLRNKPAAPAPAVAEEPLPEQQPAPAEMGPAPQPERIRRTTPSPTPTQEQRSAPEGGGFNFKSLISAGKILVPAAQAIISVIQSQQAQAANEDPRS